MIGSLNSRFEVSNEEEEEDACLEVPLRVNLRLQVGYTCGPTVVRREGAAAYE